MHRLSLSPLLLIVTAFLSLEALSANLISVKDLPTWFQKEMLNEKKVEKKSTLKIDEFNLNTSIKGRIILADQDENTRLYHIDIGVDSPVECYVFTEFDGTATSFFAIRELSLTGAAELNKKELLGQFTFAVSTGLIGSTPYLSLDTLYHLGGEGETSAGLLKGLAARTPSSLQVCVHNQIGYSDSFFEVFTSFVEAIEQNQSNDAFFDIIYRLTVNGIDAGYGRESFTIDKEGDIGSQSETAILMPVDASALARLDSLSRAWENANGTLINAYSETLENGAYAYYYSLDFKDDVWIAQGETQGKAQSFTIADSSTLTGSYGVYRKSAELLKSDMQATEATVWSPDTDPSSFTSIKLSKLKADSGGNLLLDMGVVAIKSQVDSNGVMSRGTLTQGPLTMVMDVMYKKGAP